jgi:hypothetical protein
MTARPIYSTFNLDNLLDEEKLRFVLSVLTVDQTHRLAKAVAQVKKAGFGAVTFVVCEGNIDLLQVTTSEKEKA